MRIEPARKHGPFDVRWAGFRSRPARIDAVASSGSAKLPRAKGAK